MSQDSIFTDEWRECLRAQYMDVCRRDDRRNGETLTRVMREIGFTDGELNELRLRVTMRDMPADYVPDMNEIEDYAGSGDLVEPSDTVGTRHVVSVPAESAFIEEELFEEDTQIEPPDAEDPDGPEQLSLF